MDARERGAPAPGGLAVSYLHGHDLTDLCRQLVGRGWWITEAEMTEEGAIIGFDFMPRVRPNWLKAFEVKGAECGIDGIERQVEAWRADVLQRLEACDLSPTVRRLLAEHGVDAVRAAMTGRQMEPTA